MQNWSLQSRYSTHTLLTKRKLCHACQAVRSTRSRSSISGDAPAGDPPSKDVFAALLGSASTPGAMGITTGACGDGRNITDYEQADDGFFGNRLSLEQDNRTESKSGTAVIPGTESDSAGGTREEASYSMQRGDDGRHVALAFSGHRAAEVTNVRDVCIS